jgi:hypothetical protein
VVTGVDGAALEVEGVVLVEVVVVEEVAVAEDADGVSRRDSRQKGRRFEMIIRIRELEEEQYDHELRVGNLESSALTIARTSNTSGIDARQGRSWISYKGEDGRAGAAFGKPGRGAKLHFERRMIPL